MKSKKTIYLLFIAIIQALECSTAVIFKEIANKMIAGSSKLTFSKRSVIDCCRECVRIKGCHAASFDMEVDICTLELSGFCHALVETAHRKVLLKRSLQSIKLAVCPAGWDHYQHFCYYFSSDMLPWSEAQQMCFSYGAVLAEPISFDQMNYIATTANLYGTSFWVGGSYNIVDQKWKWQSTCGEMGYTNWFPGQPEGNNFTQVLGCSYGIMVTGSGTTLHVPGLKTSSVK